MHPNIVEFEIFHKTFPITWYGLLLSLSFLFGIYLSMYRAQKVGIDKNTIMDLAIVIVLSAVIGSRFQYVVTHVSEFKDNWLNVINPVPDGRVGIGGLSMLGGVVLSIIALVIFARRKKLSLLDLGDVVSPAFALGIGLTRIGCFMVGCCFGRPCFPHLEQHAETVVKATKHIHWLWPLKDCHLKWGVVFPSHSIPYTTSDKFGDYIASGTHLHPTQLYSSVYGWIILIVLLLLGRKYRFPGFIIAVFFMMYGVARFSVDFVRFYNDSLFRLFGHEWTINQVICLLMFSIGLAMLIILSKKKRSALESV